MLPSFCSRPVRALLLMAVLLVVVGGVVQSLSPLHNVAAQIGTNQPAQPFASVVSCINLTNPSAAAPRLATTCYASRLHDGGYTDLGGDVNNGDGLASDTAVIEFGDAQADNSADLYNVPTNGHAPLSTVGEVGSVYGLAYATGTNPAAPAVAQQQRLFVGAYQKRLTRFGPSGPGGVYLVNRSNGAKSAYVTVPNVVPGPNGAPYNAGDGTQARFPNDPAGNYAYTPEMGGLHRPGNDGNEQGYVGKASLGDVAIDPQEHYLYAVNLNNRRVYRFDTWSANPQATMTVLADSVAALNPCSTRGGTQNYHPFGLLVTADSVYLGSTCTAESTGSQADLAVRVDRLVLATNTWGVTLGVGLNAFDTQRGTWGGNDLHWHPWASDGGSVYSMPQPILSGLALDEAGNLVLGLRDRYGDLSSNGRSVSSESQGASQGDLLLAAPNGTGGWIPPSGAGSEYFSDGTTTQGSYPSGWIHGESTWGAVAYVPGRHGGGYGGEVVSTVISPYRINSGGAAWWDASGGAATAREEVYQTNSITQNTFQKAAGLGDLALLCAWRAIGDRVWRDTNGNGVQDAGEASISGVRMQLVDAGGTVVATVTTGSVAGMPGNYRFYVNPFAAYTVRIDPSMFGAGQPLAGLALTTQNAGGDDATDSDAAASGNVAIPAAGNGDVTITYDFGLVSGANVRITKTGPATALPGQTISFNLAYANDGPAAAQNVTVVDNLPAGLSYASANPAPSNVNGQAITWNLGTIAAGASGVLTVQATVFGLANGSYTNQVQISTTTTNDNPGDNTSTSTVNVIRPNVAIQKTGPATVTAGGNIAYTLNYQNTGAATADGVSVVDTLPAGETFVSAAPAPSSVAGQTLTWNLGSLGAGASGSITVNVQSSSGLANGATLTNQAQISTTSPGDTPGDNTSTTTTTAQRADVYLTKSSPTTFPVASGQPVTYYLDYGNRGPAAADGVQLVDTVPSQLTGVSWTCSSGCAGSGSGNAISLNLGTLAAGATGRVTVTGTATTALAREDFTNTAMISTSTPETDTTNNQSSVPGAVWTTDLQIIKLADAQAVAGTTFGATLTYRNNGPAPAAAATLVDTLPAGISLASANPAPTSVSGQTLTWNLGTLADAQNGVITLVLRADPTLADGTTVTNQSQISTTTSDRTPGNNTSSADTLIIARADLQITKTGPARVNAGDDVVFTLTYVNNGPSVARAVTIADTLPGELDFVSATPAPTTNSGGVLTWNIGDLNPSATGTITVRMRSRFDQDTATLAATNAARITTTTTDLTPGNDTSSHTVAVETVDLSIAKTMPAYVIAGVPFTATLAYANAGPADATSVTLRDLAPSGLTFVSANPAPTGPGLRWSLGTLAAGGSGAITVRFLATSTVVSGTQFLNQAIIDTASHDRDSANDIAQARTTVRPNADLAIVKTGTSGPILSGSRVSYTLAYRNNGPSQSLGVVVADTPPPGFTFASAAPAPDAGGALRWTVGDLDAGASGVITVVGTLTGDAASTTRTNSAAIASGATPDPVPGNNTSSTSTTVVQPDLSITKTDGQTQAQPGDLLTYTLTIRNSGPITATNATLTETPPVPILDPQWTAQGNGSYTLLVGDLPPGASITRTVTIRLPNPLPQALRTKIANVATVSIPCCTDPTPGDNTTTDEDAPLIGRVGDFIWLDADGDGQQDSGEKGLANVPLELLDPLTGTILATVTTDAQGGYHFDGLRLGDYAVRISPQAMDAVYKDYAATTEPIRVTALTPGTPRDDTLDIGLKPNNPTTVVLAYLLIERQSDGNLIRWGTLAEKDTKLFRVERTATRNRTSAVVVGTVDSQGSKGGDYRLADPGAPTFGPVYYWLIELENSGRENRYGPASSSAQSVRSSVYLPLVRY